MTFQQKREWHEMQQKIKNLTELTEKQTEIISSISERLAHIENRSKPGPKGKSNG